MPKISGLATTTLRRAVITSAPPDPAWNRRAGSVCERETSETRFVLGLRYVLVLAAVRLEHVGRGAAQPALRVVDSREHARAERLALQAGDEALPAQVLAAGDQQCGHQLRAAPQAVADVVAGLVVLGLVRLL